MVSIRVDVAPSYTIHIEPGLLEQRLNLGGAANRQVCVVSDPSIFGIYGKTLQAALGAGVRFWSCQIPSGESSKTLDVVSRVYNALAEQRFERGDVLLALGGGVVGDVTGFVASTYLRGVPYVQVPTTLLAQVDSSVGGKTGVDHPAGKNLIGAFYQPSAVWIDPHVLRTLPLNQRRSGLAEVVKYGVIADAELFAYLEENVGVLGHDVVRDEDWPVWTHVIQRCCDIKAQIVKEDEKETTGRRAILNFGHTFGHAFENLYGYEHLLHGEAIAVGMRAAGRLTRAIGLWPQDSLERMESLFDQLGLPSQVKALDIAKILRVMQSDKKVQSGKVRLVLPTRIGEASLRGDVDPAQIRAALASVVGDAALVRS